MSRRGLAAALLGACALPAVLAGCATCQPERAPVEPRVGGGVSIGSSGTTSGLGLGLDVSNLFCRPPDPSTQPQPGPADEPIPDPPDAARPEEAAPVR